MKNEPTVEKWRDEIYNAICLVNLTDRVGEGIKKVIEVFKKYQAHSVQEAREEERERILSDFACIGATIPKYNSQGWTHWIDEYIRKNGLDPVAIRGKYLSTLNTKEGHDK